MIPFFSPASTTNNPFNKFQTFSAQPTTTRNEDVRAPLKRKLGHEFHQFIIPDSQSATDEIQDDDEQDEQHPVFDYEYEDGGGADSAYGGSTPANKYSTLDAIRTQVDEIEDLECRTDPVTDEQYQSYEQEVVTEKDGNECTSDEAELDQQLKLAVEQFKHVLDSAVESIVTSTQY
jgi:hypothetical protein